MEVDNRCRTAEEAMKNRQVFTHQRMIRYVAADKWWKHPIGSQNNAIRTNLRIQTGQNKSFSNDNAFKRTPALHQSKR